MSEVDHRLSQETPLPETGIDFFGSPDVQFHFNSGRNASGGEDGRMSIIVSPHVDVYDRRDEEVNTGVHFIVYLPAYEPIVIDHICVTDGHEEFLDTLVEELERGYDGIDEVDKFTDNSSGSLGEEVRAALDRNTPESVRITSRPVQNR